jgi:hypothetical protein
LRIAECASRGGGRVLITVWFALTAAAVWLILDPASAPIGVLAMLASAYFPLWRAWRSARGTALGWAVGWMAVAVLLAGVGQVEALREPLETGRPWAGHWAYLAALGTLAALVSVLNARQPGHVAWALLMGLLVVVLLIPWLEAGGVGQVGAQWSRLRLQTPWNLFYWLLVVTAVSNYLPTRFGLAAAWLGLALGLEYVGLTWASGPGSVRAVFWSAGPLALAAGLWAAEAAARKQAPGKPGVERLWLWFRDGWGVVWGLRVEERFNREAELLGWPIRLGWFGLQAAPGAVEEASGETLDAAAQTLRGLLRRFAQSDRLQAEMGNAGFDPCHRTGPNRIMEEGGH